MLRLFISLLLSVAILGQLSVLMSGAFRDTNTTANAFSSWLTVNSYFRWTGQRVDIWTWKTIDAALFGKVFDAQRTALFHLFLSVCVTAGMTLLSTIPFWLKWHVPYLLAIFTAFVSYGVSLILMLTQVDSAFRLAMTAYGPSFYVWNVTGGAILIAIFCSFFIKRSSSSKKYRDF